MLIIQTILWLILNGRTTIYLEEGLILLLFDGTTWNTEGDYCN